MATATETLHDFDPTAGFDIDQETVEQPENLGPQYPIIQWHYGDQRMAKAGGMDHQGGWFYSIDAGEAESEEQKERKATLKAAMAEQGWTEETWIHDSGDSTVGMYKREIAVSVVSTRKCWEAYDANSQRHSFPWSAYDSAQEIGRPSSRLHVLCLVKGLEEHGPFVLTLKGSAAMSFEGTRRMNGALQDFTRTIIKAANDASAQAAAKANKPAPRWPYRCFWLPVGAERDAKGAPVFTEVGSGANIARICLPVALGLPSNGDVELKRFYVGKELQEQGTALYEENEEWRHAWDEMDNSPVEEPEPTTAAATTSEETLANLGL